MDGRNGSSTLPRAPLLAYGSELCFASIHFMLCAAAPLIAYSHSSKSCRSARTSSAPERMSKSFPRLRPSAYSCGTRSSGTTVCRYSLSSASPMSTLFSQ